MIEISKIQKLYKKYEQIITDIQYDSLNDKVYISHRGNVVLNYVCLKIDLIFYDLLNSIHILNILDFQAIQMIFVQSIVFNKINKIVL